MNNDKVLSSVTGKTYSPHEVCRIVNIQQITKYIECGAEILDIYTSLDYKTNNPILVFIFSRKDTQHLYELWCRHEL